MKLKTNIIATIFVTFFIFTGCSKDIEEYNKPAIFWYSQLVSAIANHDLEKGDARKCALAQQAILQRRGPSHLLCSKESASASTRNHRANPHTKLHGESGVSSLPRTIHHSLVGVVSNVTG